MENISDSTLMGMMCGTIAFISFLVGKMFGIYTAQLSAYKRGVHDERKVNSYMVAEKMALALEEKAMNGELDVRYIDSQSVSFTVLVKYRNPERAT